MVEMITGAMLIVAVYSAVTASIALYNILSMQMQINRLNDLHGFELAAAARHDNDDKKALKEKIQFEEVSPASTEAAREYKDNEKTITL